MASATTTTVRPLLKTPTSIRLVQLRRNAESITGLLKTVDHDAPDCPSFTTLSYTWGAVEHTRSITLYGQPFPILTTVYPILEALCDGSKFDSEAWYWVDKICINQANLEERASQVRLMGRVYATSARRAVWLSPATDEMDRAVDLFVQLSAWNYSDELSFIDATEWRTWGALLQLPWWRRVWTLQEFIIPNNVDFHCGGDKSFSREQFQKAMVTHANYPDADVPPAVWLPAWN